MTSIAYSFEVRNTDSSLVTGLTPVVNAIKKESDNTTLTGVTITFTETVPGFYKFYYDAIANGEAFLQVDLGSALGTSRYLNIQLTLDSTPNLLASLIDTGVSVKQAIKGMVAVLFGNSTATSSSIAYKDQSGNIVITGGTFDGNGGRTITKGTL